MGRVPDRPGHRVAIVPGTSASPFERHREEPVVAMPDHEDPSPVFSPGFVARAAKGSQVLGFSRIGRRRRSSATLRSTICEKRDR